MGSPEDFYRQFFDVMQGLIPDYGGRNLDALHDDLTELTEPLTLYWDDSDQAKEQLGEWFEKCLHTLKDREGWQPVKVVLR